MRPGALCLVAVALVWTAAAASAQVARPAPRFVTPDTVRRVPPPPLVALLSAAVPGAGERVLRLDRWAPQLALELLGWWEYRGHRRTARDYERRYRALACQVARRIVYPKGECPDTSDFEYYESMGKTRYSNSGSFDSDPLAPGVQPETDPGTYNGQIWLAALSLSSGPGALAYYETHAIPPAYRWNWGENTLEQTVYDELIRRGDDAFRTSSRILGLILADHAASAIDAFIVARLRQIAQAPRIDVRTGFVPVGGGLRWTAELRLRPAR